MIRTDITFSPEAEQFILELAADAKPTCDIILSYVLKTERIDPATGHRTQSKGPHIAASLEKAQGDEDAAILPTSNRAVVLNGFDKVPNAEIVLMTDHPSAYLAIRSAGH